MVSRVRTLVLLGFALTACDAHKTGATEKTDSAASAAATPKAAADTPAAAAAAADPKTNAADISPAQAPPDTWMAFSSKEDAFEVRFPVAPKKDTFDAPNPLGGTIPNVMYMAEQGSQALGVNVMTLPASTLPEFDVDKGLDGGRDGMVNNIGGTILSEKHVDFEGHPARAIEAKAKNGTLDVRIEARLFFVSPRLYQLISVSDAAEPSPAKKFFDSFALLSD